jgi:murein DD-endopeptidase MepM/ murein hydrolase activator NlpD
MWAKMNSVLPSIPTHWALGIFAFDRGPVAQLGARFHGMEEVVGSIPTRSTIILASSRDLQPQPKRSQHRVFVEDRRRGQEEECYASKMGSRLTIPAGLFFLVCWFSLSVPPASAANWTVHAQPARLINGGPVLFQVKPPTRLESLHGTWLGHELSFSFDATSRTWYALAGVSLETAPGTYSLELSGETPTGKAPGNKVAFARKFAVAAGKYPRIEVKLSVAGKFTEPDPEQQKQIAEGVQVKKDYLNRVTPEREWSGQFGTPAEAAISDVFGSERIFNGKTSSPHLGLDFRVPSGTPVAAMNDGTVLLARPLYFEGNFVVLDHGQGLLTLYLHLSEFKVKEGDQVKRGQVIGLSGGTGRATGPHLHVAVRWQGTYLDPAQLMRLRLPQLAAGN